MSQRESNERVIQRVLKAVGNRDVAVLQACLHPDIVWHQMGSGGLAGDYEGVGAVMTYLAGMFETSGDSLALDVHDVVAGERHVAVLVRLTAQRGGSSYDDRSVFVMAVADDKITEGWVYNADQVRSAEFWS
jgi:ketosteroid isomerase-like protein